MPPGPRSRRSDTTASSFGERLETAWRRRASIADSGKATAYRLIDGRGDGVPGVYLDRYGPAAVLNVHEDARLSQAAVTAAARATLDVLRPSGVESVYVKPFARNRTRLRGRTSDESRVALPRAGVRQPETLVVREYESHFDVRLYDGHSTGLFLDQREHRRALAERRPGRVLNLFAYTCGFAIPLAAVGAHVTNVDASRRYLDWGKRNLALNGLDASAARFVRMDAVEYLAYAARKRERFDLVILDPPTFAAGDRRRKIARWMAVEHYPALVQAATRVLAPGGAVFASSNTRELAERGALTQMVERVLGATPAWMPLPPWPVDVTETGRVAAVMFAV